MEDDHESNQKTSTTFKIVGESTKLCFLSSIGNYKSDCKNRI